jgi:hypothetical protein
MEIYSDDLILDTINNDNRNSLNLNQVYFSGFKEIEFNKIIFKNYYEKKSVSRYILS